ncbi:MAG: UDP-N-acetylmuramate dehydrogenase [Bacteroidota bacterium]
MFLQRYSILSIRYFYSSIIFIQSDDLQHFTQYSLKELNTFGIDVHCQHFFSVEDEQALQDLLTDPSFKSLKDNYPDFLVIGGGSNILFTKDVKGIVLKISIGGVTFREEMDEHIVVRVGAGVEWHYFVDFAVLQDWGGIENLSCIPGTVGAAPMQNIGAYGVEVANVIEAVHAYDTHEDRFVRFSKEECAFGYRESFFKREGKDRYIITSVDFRLTRKHVLHLDYGAIKDELMKQKIENPGITDVSRVVCAIRASKLPQPKQIGNAGSFFKNPVIDVQLMETLHSHHPDIPHHASGEGFKVPAGWLIEQAGWKGYREGDAGCHEKQALVLVNHGKATGREILNLASKIQEDVFGKFGISLEREVNIFS